MENKIEPIPIGTIRNEYGGIFVARYNGKFYWTIEQPYDSLDDINEYEEIDRELFENLIKWEHRRLKSLDS